MYEKFAVCDLCSGRVCHLGERGAGRTAMRVHWHDRRAKRAGTEGLVTF